MHKKFYVSLGRNIKKYRNKAGLTQQNLADKVGISLNFMGKIEVAFSKPSIDTLVDIANTLNVTVSQLCEMEND